MFPSTACSMAKDVSVIEANAMRYVQDMLYVKCKKKIKESSHELKEDINDCLMKMFLCEGESEGKKDEEWIDLVDRGGLWHVRESTFQFFFALEDGVRQYLSQLTSPSSHPSIKEFISMLVMNNDVQLYWHIAMAAFVVDDIDVSNSLLRMIVELYVTIRGFSYANGWIEQYKQTHKRSTQQSKGLRKKLYTNKNS